MSIACQARIWKNSNCGGTELLLLLAIADFADDEGTAYPSVRVLSEKIRMSERNTHYLISKLQQCGELLVELGAGPRGSNLYQVNIIAREQVQDLQGVQSLQVQPVAGGGATHGGKGVQPTAPKPLGKHHRTTIERDNTQGKRLPEDFELPTDWLEWARLKRPEIDASIESEKFIDHWLSVPGSKGRKLDWLRTWRNWIRNARSNGNIPPNKDMRDLANEELIEIQKMNRSRANDRPNSEPMLCAPEIHEGRQRRSSVAANPSGDLWSDSPAIE